MEREAFDGIEVSEGSRWICVKDLVKENDFRCVILVIYGWHNCNRRASLWQELLNVRINIDYPMMVIGDFNEVLSLDKRKRSAGNMGSMEDFA